MENNKIDEGIICPNCGKFSNGAIIDTRLTINGRRRRRVCEFCGKRYTTIEKSIVSKTVVVEGGEKNETKET